MCAVAELMGLEATQMRFDELLPGKPKGHGCYVGALLGPRI